MIDSGIVQAGLLKPGIVGVGLVSPYSRYFRTNDDLSYISIPEVTFSGDFVIEFDFLTTGTSNQLLLGDSHTSAYYFNTYVSSGQRSFDVWIAGVRYNFNAFQAGIIDIEDQINSVKYSLVGTTLSLEVNGTSLGGKTVTPYAGINSFRLYSSNSVIENNLSGILANLKIYDNGTLVRNYPINDNSNIIANAAASLGAELYGMSDNIPAVGGGTVISDTGVQAVAGRTYLVTVNSDGAGSVSIRVGSGSNETITPPIPVQIGVSSYVLTPLVSENFEIVARGGSSVPGSITTSIKEAPGYGSVVNGNASDWELFNQQADGDWLGQELFINPVINSPWVDNGDGSYSIDGSQPSTTDLFVGSTNAVGNDYRFSADASVSGGVVRLRVGDAAGQFGDISTTGASSFDLEAGIVNSTVRALVGFSGSVSNVSQKRLLRIA